MQMIIMLAGFVAVIARGAVLQGGLGTIWKDAADGGRLVAFEFVHNHIIDKHYLKQTANFT